MTTITKTFSATGTSGTLTIASNQAMTYQITGSFSASLNLESTLDGGKTWAPLLTFTALVAQTVLPGPGTFRFNCTSYTSGSPAITLADVNNVLSQTVNTKGQVIQTISDQGITNNGIVGWAGFENSVTAAAGGTQAAATGLSALASVHRISVCATNADSVALPTLVVGSLHMIVNDGAADAQVFGAGTDTIDGVATATGVALPAGKRALYYAYASGKWISLLGA